MTLYFSTPHGERSIVALTGKPQHIAAAMRKYASPDWVLVRVEAEPAQ